MTQAFMEAERPQTQYIDMTKYTEDTPYGADNMHFRSVIERLTPNQGAQMLRYGWEREGILSLAQGEGSCKTPDFIAKAAYQALQDGQTFYAPALGVPSLRQEISNYYQKLMNLSLPTNRIFATGSGTTAMHLALTSILEEGDEVVAVTPVWKNLLGAIELTQSKTIQVPLEAHEDGWVLDMDKLFDACTSKTKAILIVSPSNPTGWIMPKKDMQALLDFARDRGIWIVADEVYHRLAYTMPYAPSFLEIAQPEDRLFSINSFSKAYAMTGWRLGWLVGPAQSEDVIRDIALYDNMGPPTYAQYGAIEALRHGEEFIKEQLDLWHGNKVKLESYFATKKQVIMPSSPATFYAFFKVEGQEDCLSFAKELIDEAALSLAPGCAFGKDCKGWMRLCYAVSAEKMDDAIQRLDSVIG